MERSILTVWTCLLGSDRLIDKLIDILVTFKDMDSFNSSPPGQNGRHFSWMKKFEFW